MKFASRDFLEKTAVQHGVMKQAVSFQKHENVLNLLSLLFFFFFPNLVSANDEKLNSELFWKREEKKDKKNFRVSVVNVKSIVILPLINVCSTWQ